MKEVQELVSEASLRRLIGPRSIGWQMRCARQRGYRFHFLFH